MDLKAEDNSLRWRVAKVRNFFCYYAAFFSWGCGGQLENNTFSNKTKRSSIKGCKYQMTNQWSFDGAGQQKTSNSHSLCLSRENELPRLSPDRCSQLMMCEEEINIPQLACPMEAMRSIMLMLVINKHTRTVCGDKKLLVPITFAIPGHPPHLFSVVLISGQPLLLIKWKSNQHPIRLDTV